MPRLRPALLVSISLLLFGIALSLLAPQAIVYFFEDDAFFYLKTAGNIRAGLGSTYDGLNVTNGYHPLYMLWLVGWAFVRPLQGGTGLHLIFLSDVLLTAVGLLLTGRVLRQLGLPAGVRLAVLISATGFVGMAHMGMEVKLLLPLAWALIACALGEHHDRRRSICIAALGPLIVLTRLDALPFVVLVTAAYAFAAESAPHRRIISLARLVAPTAAALLLYAVYNQLLFGYPSSVSSALKLHWPGALASGWPLLAGRGTWLRLGVCGGSAVAYLLFWLRSGRHTTPMRHQALLLALNLSNLLYLAALLLLSVTEPRAWYYALPLSVALVAGVVYGTLLHQQHQAAFADGIALGRWMQANLPAGARIFQVDESGMTGYFSQRAVINGDGLINSWAYQAALEEMIYWGIWPRRRSRIWCGTTTRRRSASLCRCRCGIRATSCSHFVHRRVRWRALGSICCWKQGRPIWWYQSVCW